MSVRSGGTHRTSQRSDGPSNVKKSMAGARAVKIIEWYFYPELAPKKLFKNKCVRQDLKAVTGKHYEVLSQASNCWSQSEKTVPVSNSPYANQQSMGDSGSIRSGGGVSNFEYMSTPTKSIRSEAHNDKQVRHYYGALGQGGTLDMSK